VTGAESGIVDPEGAIARGYGIGEHGVALIRPDGYFGYASTDSDDQRLLDHLTATLHPLRQPVGP